LSAFSGWAVLGYLALGGRGLLRFLGGAGGGHSRRFRRLLVERQPGASLLQLHAVSGVTDGIDEWVYARHQLAGAGRDHRGSWREQALIPERSDQRHYAVWRPGHEEQEADGDGRLGYPDFSRLLAFIHIRAQ